MTSPGRRRPDPNFSHHISPCRNTSPNRHPATTVTSGRIAASARTMVDFAVPFSPRTSTPPIEGDTALRTKPSRSSSIPTTALNGNPFMLRPPVRPGCECRDWTNHDTLLSSVDQPRQTPGPGGGHGWGWSCH